MIVFVARTTLRVPIVKALTAVLPCTFTDAGTTATPLLLEMVTV